MRTFGLIRAALCYGFWCYVLPQRWKLSRLGLGLLPYVGDWAYKDDGGRFDRSGSSGFGNGVCQAPD